jgi:hypothetical protein
MVDIDEALRIAAMLRSHVAGAIGSISKAPDLIVEMAEEIKVLRGLGDTFVTKPVDPKRHVGW